MHCSVIKPFLRDSLPILVNYWVVKRNGNLSLNCRNCQRKQIRRFNSHTCWRYCQLPLKMLRSTLIFLNMQSLNETSIMVLPRRLDGFTTKEVIWTPANRSMSLLSVFMISPCTENTESYVVLSCIVRFYCPSFNFLIARVMSRL